MKRTSFLQRQLLFSLLGTILLVLGGFAAFGLYVRHDRERDLNRLRGSMPGPAQTVAIFLELSENEAPESILRKLVERQAHFGPLAFFVLDGERRVLATNTPEVAPPPLTELPKTPGESLRLDEGPDPFRPQIVRLRTSAERYLVALHRPPPGRPDFGARPPPRVPGAPPTELFVFVVLGAILSALLSFAVLFYYLRSNSVVIEDVMNRIRGGDLKARFPVKKLDEVGRLMTAFNAMAGEIEALVARIRENEKVRTRLLEELGHDLRTPLASLKNCLETLELKETSLVPEQRRELVGIAHKESAYLGRLVEDLLFLARVDDPRYSTRGQLIHLEDILGPELERFRATSAKRLRFEGKVTQELVADPQLLKRFVRNALENAGNHARQEIVLRIEADPRFVSIVIEDDGPGFPPELLENFGLRRPTRDYEPGPDGRISLGLGGVIMKAIVDAHHGKFEVSNRPNGSGASIIARFPSNS